MENKKKKKEIANKIRISTNKDSNFFFIMNEGSVKIQLPYEFKTRI